MSIADWFTPTSNPYRTLESAPLWSVPMAATKTIHDIRLECMDRVKRAEYQTEAAYFDAVERLAQFVLTGKHSDETGG